MGTLKQLVELLVAGGPGDVVGDSAGVLVHLQIDVPLNSPVGVPAVADNPIRHGSSGIESHKLHTVVHFAPSYGWAALKVGQYSAGIILPVGSIQADGQWPDGSKTSWQSRFVFGDGSVRRYFSINVLGIELALAVRGSVGVVHNLLLSSRLLNVFIGGLGITSIATLNTIDGVAIHDLLRGQVDRRNGGVSFEDPC